MVIPAIFYLIISLIVGIFFMFVGCSAVNDYIMNPEKKVSLISIIFPFILGIIGIMGAIYGFISILLLITFIIFIIFYSYSLYVSIKYPEKQEEYLEKWEKHREMYKKRPLYNYLRIIKYIMLSCAIFCSIFILIVVLFDI